MKDIANNRNALLLLGCFAVTFCFFAANGIFVTAFFFSESKSLIPVARFQFTFQTSMLVMSLIMGPYIKAGPAAPYLRYSFFAHSAVFAVLLTAPKEWLYSIELCGALAGIAAALFWNSANIITFRITSPNERLSFFSYMNIVGKIVFITIPFLSGWLVYATGSYTLLFSLMLLLIIPGTILSFKITSERPQDLPPYSLRVFWSKAIESADIKNLLKSFVFNGASLTGPLLVLIPLMVFRASGSEFTLGVVASAMPLIEVCSSLWVRRLKVPQYTKTILISSLLILLATVVVLQTFSLTSSIVYASVFALCFPVLIILFSVYSVQVMEKHEEFKPLFVEYTIVRECVLTLGRIITWGIVMAVIYFINEDDSTLQYIFLGLSLSLIPHAFHLSRIKLKLRSEYDNK